MRWSPTESAALHMVAVLRSPVVLPRIFVLPHSAAAMVYLSLSAYSNPLLTPACTKVAIPPANITARIPHTGNPKVRLLRVSFMLSHHKPWSPFVRSTHVGMISSRHTTPSNEPHAGDDPLTHATAHRPHSRSIASQSVASYPHRFEGKQLRGVPEALHGGNRAW